MLLEFQLIIQMGPRKMSTNKMGIPQKKKIMWGPDPQVENHCHLYILYTVSLCKKKKKKD